MTASTRPIHSRQRAGAGRSSSSGSSSPSGFRVSRHRSRARRAGTSRVRSVRGSRRARPAGRTVVARRAPKLPGDFCRGAQANRRRAAPAARPAPPWRAISARPRAAFAPAARARRTRSQACAAALGVGEQDARRLRAVGDVAARAPPGAREQRRGEQRQRERPFQPLGEHGVGEPGREQFALPSPAGAARRPASGRAARGRRRARRRTAPGDRPAAQASAASIASCNASSRGTPKNLGGGVERLSAIARPSARRAPARRGAGVPPARDRRPAG